METYTLQHIKTEYQQLITQMKKKTMIVLAFINLIASMIAALSLVLSFYISAFLIVFYVFIGITALFIFIIIMVHFFYVPEKPLYTYLYPKIIAQINDDLNMNIIYESYVKDKDFAKSSLLYTAFASKILRYKLSFESHNVMVDIHDAYLFTQTNNSTIVYLNGWFIQIPDYFGPIMQLRTKFSPQKRSQYKRLSNIDRFKVYIQNQADETIPENIKRILDLIQSAINQKDIALSAINHTLYLGIDYKPIIRRVKVLDNQTYQALYDQLSTLIYLVDNIQKEF